MKTQELDALEYAFAVIANVAGGDWEKETKDWQEAAARFRTMYHAILDKEGAARDLALQRVRMKEAMKMDRSADYEGHIL